MGMLMFLQVLLQTKRLFAKAALEALLRVVFLVVALQSEFGLEEQLAHANVALKHADRVFGVQRGCLAY